MIGSTNAIRTRFSLVDNTQLKISLLSVFDNIFKDKTVQLYLRDMVASVPDP